MQNRFEDENGKNKPGLDTLANIAKALNVTIDELYFGKESLKPITSSNNNGELFVNCIYTLWKYDILAPMYTKPKDDLYITLSKYRSQLQNLIVMLEEFKRRKNNFTDPDLYLEQLLNSVANEINSFDNGSGCVK